MEGRRRTLGFVLGALLLATGAWMVWPDEEPLVAEAAPEPTEVVESATPEAEASPAAVEQLDAGTRDAGAADSGVPSASASAASARHALDEAALAQQVMKRWRDAPVPLFRSRRTGGKVESKILTASADVPAPASNDGGIELACLDRTLPLPLSDRGSVDFLIAIDTSGSMFGELPDVARWLTTLELALRNRAVDFQLVVVADTGAFARQKAALIVDGGLVHERIGSQDAFETLIRSARGGTGIRWPQLLRPGALKHVVVVTDDEAMDKSGQPYLPLLIEAAGGALGTATRPDFALHLLGGFEAVDGAVLPPSAALAAKRCRPGGVAPGMAYQRIAVTTGGLRASLCSAAAISGLANALAEWTIPAQGSDCMWLLPLEPLERVVEVRAIAKTGGVYRLYEANSANACVGRRDAWRLSDRFLALCQSSCEWIKQEGFTSVEVHTQCGR